MPPPTIYCDESGFTGTDLLNTDQQLFVYASVCISEADAGRMIQNIKEEYHVQGDDVKGKNLVKHRPGQNAVSYLLKQIASSSRIFFADKVYALACKFFEYIFEPTISDNNRLFYEINFHRYVSTLLYICLKAGETPADILFTDFQQIMRKGDEGALRKLLKTPTPPSQEDPLQQIITFAWLNRKTIAGEISDLNDSSAGKWSLDLTTTALNSLLIEWGQIHDEFDVICDESKPLSADLSIFKHMVNRKQHHTMTFQGKEHPITFNLASPITFANSKTSAGIQIADILAAAARVTLQSPSESPGKEWMKLIGPMLSPHSVAHDAANMDLHTLEGMRNGIVMHELIARSKRGHNLLENMPFYVASVTAMLKADGH